MTNSYAQPEAERTLWQKHNILSQHAAKLKQTVANLATDVKIFDSKRSALENQCSSLQLRENDSAQQWAAFVGSAFDHVTESIRAHS